MKNWAALLFVLVASNAYAQQAYQGPVMFAASCVNSPKYGNSQVCWDTTLSEWAYWNPTTQQFTLTTPGVTYFYAINYGVKCDDSTDDTAAINLGLTAAAAACDYAHGYSEHTSVFEMPGNGAVCKTVTSINLNASCVRFDGNGSTIHAATGSGSLHVFNVTRGTQSGTSPYGNVTGGISNVHINGPGGSSSVGVDLNGISNATFERLDIFNVADPIKVDANNTFLDKFVNIDMSNFTHAGFWCPGGFSNTGENMRMDNILIFNSFPSEGYGVLNNGCEINGDRWSIDFVNDSAIADAIDGSADYTANIKLTNYHIERGGANQVMSDPVIDVGGGSGGSGGSAWSSVQLDHGQILNDDGRALSKPSSVVGNGTTATITVTNGSSFTTGDNIGINGCSDTAWDGIQGPITVSSNTITFTSTLATSPTGCEIGDKPDALAIVRDNAFADHSATGGFGTPSGAWAFLQDTQVVGWAVGGPCTAYSPLDINASCVLGNNAGKVTFFNDTDGWGGGQALSVGLGTMTTGITGTSANCLYADTNGIIHGLGSACGSASPTVYSTVGTFFPGNLTGATLGGFFKAPAAGTVTGVNMAFGTAQATCSQAVVFHVGDCGSTLTTGGTACDTTQLCVATAVDTNKLQHVNCTSGNTFSSGDYIELLIATPASGCGTTPANAQVNFQFSVR